jgi:exonuclease III
MNCPGSGCTWVNQSEAEIHMDYVVKSIEQLNPDIINFCEIEGCDELSIIKDKLNDSTYEYYLKKGTDTSTGQNVGMLTRVDPTVDLYRTEMQYSYPIENSACGYNGSTKTSGVSKHYITEFHINNYNIALIAAHLIAIPLDASRCAQREAQASILQTMIYSYIQKGYEVIMLGDFNDFDAEILDMNQNKPLSKTLDILKGNDGELASKYTLYNIAADISQENRYTDWWDSDDNCNTSSPDDYSMIDHILVTNAIKSNIINAFIYHAYDEYCGKYDSDHYPLVVDFLF